MSERRKSNPEAWEPKIDPEPEFNAFVSPINRDGRLEATQPLDDPEAEEGESVEDERVEDETTRTTAPISPTKIR
jgi:hypothetical protein